MCALIMLRSLVRFQLAPPLNRTFVAGPDLAGRAAPHCTTSGGWWCSTQVTSACRWCGSGRGPFVGRPGRALVADRRAPQLPRQRSSGSPRLPGSDSATALRHKCEDPLAGVPGQRSAGLRSGLIPGSESSSGGGHRSCQLLARVSVLCTVSPRAHRGPRSYRPEADRSGSRCGPRRRRMPGLVLPRP